MVIQVTCYCEIKDRYLHLSQQRFLGMDNHMIIKEKLPCSLIKVKRSVEQDFSYLLQQEYALLAQSIADGKFKHAGFEGGFEIECWMLNNNALSFNNLDFISQVNKSWLGPEVNEAQLEINTQPMNLSGNFLSRMHQHIIERWQYVSSKAREYHLDLLLSGLAPIDDFNNLACEKVTNLPRYNELDRRMAQLRRTHAIPISIKGRDHLQCDAQNLSVNGRNSSFQIHMRVPFQQFLAYYNTSLAIAAPILAVCCNSPFIAHHQLWQETRIPLFEQMMRIHHGNAQQDISLAGFASEYYSTSILEYFEKVITQFPHLLPFPTQQSPEQFSHLRLQNSVVYPWSRPIVDVDDKNVPHMRVEFRALPAGPTLVDMIANAALFYGLMHYYTEIAADLTQQLPGFSAKRNFYQAAEQGMHSKLIWTDQRAQSIDALFHDTLLPAAEQGLQGLGIDDEDALHYLSVIEQRISRKQTGSQYQQVLMQQVNENTDNFVARYLELQNSGYPVHQWRY